jgi:hypothetical protein
MNNIIKRFNDISIDFLTQTAQFTGYKYLFKYKFIIQFNSIVPINKFIENVLPFKQHIHDKNELFFFNKNINEPKYTNYLDDIIGIKHIYHTLDVDTKNNIWDILFVLVYLAEEKHKYSKNNDTSILVN